MGNEQRREPELGKDAGELVSHLAPGDRVQRAERLVKQQHSRLSGDGARERGTLALAARELARSCAGEMSDTEALEQIRPVAPAGEAYVCRHVEMRKQRVVLRQVADPALLGTQVNLSLGVEPQLIAESDPSGVWALEPTRDSEQRCLPGPGRSDERDRLGAEIQRDAKIERPPGQSDVDCEEVHERRSSFEVSRIAALMIMSSTPIAIA